MVAEGKDVTFKQGIYADIYVDILSLMAKCNTAPCSPCQDKIASRSMGEDWKVRRQLCLADNYSNVSFRNGSTSGTTTGFNVDLD